MRFLTSLPRAAGVAALGATTGLVLPRRLAAPAEPHKAAQPPKGAAKASELRSAMDPHLWLEDIEGEAALEWCKEQNSRAVGIVGDPHASDTYRKILAIADSKDKIPHVGRIGGRTGDEEVLRDGPLAEGVASSHSSDPWQAPVYYNFWQDADNVRGVWRRTSLASYRSDEPSWETVGPPPRLRPTCARPNGARLWQWRRTAATATYPHLPSTPSAGAQPRCSQRGGSARGGRGVGLGRVRPPRRGRRPQPVGPRAALPLAGRHLG